VQPTAEIGGEALLINGEGRRDLEGVVLNITNSLKRVQPRREGREEKARWGSGVHRDPRCGKAITDDLIL